MVKRAFSLIELIFSIVVIAIAISTLPSVTKRVLDSSEFVVNQEAIWLSTSAIYNIMAYKWDEASSQSGGDRKVLDVTTIGDFNRSSLNTPDNYRIGHIIVDGRRKFHNSVTYATNPSNLGSDGDLDDIDDFIGDKILSYLSVANSVSTFDYKNLTYTSNVNVKYISDSLNSGSYRNDSNITFKLTRSGLNQTTNIKLIELNLSTSKKSNFLNLVAFSSNIGEYLDLKNRVIE